MLASFAVLKSHSLNFMHSVTPDSSPVSIPVPPPLSPLAARVLGCLIEKEFATPDIYPLSLNALTNACNQRSNRVPEISASGSEVEIALEELRNQRLATAFTGADSRVQKFKHKLSSVYPVSLVEQAVICELLVRGPQTTAGLRSNGERLYGMPGTAELEVLLVGLAERPEGALVRKLPRQAGQKEARWTQLLTGEPTAESETGPEPITVTLSIPAEVEQRLASLESEVSLLRAELAELRKALGE